MELKTEKDIKHHVLNESDLSTHGHSELWPPAQERHRNNDEKLLCNQRSAWIANRFTGFLYRTNSERLLPEAWTSLHSNPFISIYLIMYMLVFIPIGTEMSYCFRDNVKDKLEGGEVAQ